MGLKLSKRCGKGTCKYYDKHDSTSACSMFNDRRECTESIAHHKKVAKKSKGRDNIQKWW